MGIPRIIEKVYRKPWLIKPSVHGSISTSLLTHIKGEAKACDFEEEYEEYDAEQVQIANTAIIPIQGIIGKHLSLLEMSCGCVDVDDIGLQLDRAIADESVDSIILYFATAGGTVTGIPELAGVVM